MFKWLSDKWDQWSTKGIKVPFALDAAKDKPSVSLLFLYITFWLALGSVIWLHFNDKVIIATATTIIWWFLAYVMYRIRQLDKVSVDLKSGKIEIDADEKDEEESKDLPKI